MHAERVWRGADHVTFDDAVRVIAKVLAADNPRFDRERFMEACETGHCRGMRAA